MTPEEIVDRLRRSGIEGGHHVGVALDPRVGLGLATATERIAIPTDDAVTMVRQLDAMLGPRWVWWDRATADIVAAHGVPIDRCWDVVTVHRLLAGRWRTSIGLVWAWLHELSTDTMPSMGQLDLLDTPVDEGDPHDPVRPDGHLRPEWIDGGWRSTPDRLAAWAALALEAADLQTARLRDRPRPDRAVSTAHAESVAELLCAELARAGLPIDESEAGRIIEKAVGPRPASPEEEDALRAARDRDVLDLVESSPGLNLRNAGDVKALLRRAGVEVPDTRAWRLERHRDDHPVVGALLHWRKIERIATTYGYRWLDEHVRNGRLHGEWGSSDGAAGRMTASAGLHNLPAEMRPAIAAGDGHLFVRADLGQIEPRVLAAVSGDEALVAATADDDLYEPVASRLGVAREVAKVAVLGAMYGGTTGESAHALRGLQDAYPVAMGFLEDAAAEGVAGRDVMTVGGRLVRMWVDESVAGDLDRARAVAAARGRFARNAVVQGAAAEFFKVWAIIVRRRARAFGADVVLCLHDELLVHTPEQHGGAVAALVADAVNEAAYYWSPVRDVRFVADVCTVRRWSDAK